MSYLSIPNLYKDQSILEFKHVYALEKIHGTSAHLTWKDGALTFFSGGEKYERFVSLFNIEDLTKKLTDKFGAVSEPVTIYGEAYGGKQQGMSATYGPDLKFVAFDVQIGDAWLSVPKADILCQELGLDFVDYSVITTDQIDFINAERDRVSSQAIKNGVGNDKLREGVVLRPPFEVTLNNGKRLIAKHKREEFSERTSKSDTTLDPARKVVMEQAEAITEEWVTATRLNHVLDKLKADLQRDPEIQWMPQVMARMVDDIHRESEGEVIWSDAVKKAINHKTAKVFKAVLFSNLLQQQNDGS